MRESGNERMSENLTGCISYWEFELQAVRTHPMLTHQQSGQQMGGLKILNYVDFFLWLFSTANQSIW